MGSVKFSVFADIHFMNGFWCGDVDKRLDFILERAKKENVDFIVHLGDFCHNQTTEKEAIDKYNNFEIPTYHVLGNHDLDTLTLDEVVAHYKMPSEYYYFDVKGFRFVALNANYCRVDGEDIPYGRANYFKLPRDYISKKQLDWFEEVVMSSPYPVIVFSHGNLERDDHNGGAGLKNREEFQSIVRKAHKNKKRILMCLCGHHHVDYMRIYEHVCYFSVNSATMNYLSPPHHLFPKEFHKEHYGSQSCVIYNDPIHPIITLSDDGMIEIEGMESTFFHDVTLADATGSDCQHAIKVTPTVLSEKLWLPIKL